ncbi:uncharacterized protein LOC111867761 [Cryptotermes secundus]|nr:uncharacterized protein LOC111867761 [Cryptotermes secundus]
MVTFTQVYLLITLILLVGTAPPAVGDDDICDKDRKYLDSCLQKLPSLLSRDSTTGIPSSKKSVEQACNAFKTGMQCFDLYAATCLNGDERKVMNRNVAGARHAFSYLCDDPSFQTEYLQYNSCYRKVSRDWDFCANRFLERVNNSHTRAFDICCANHAFLDCVYDVGMKKCHHKAADFLRKIAGILANVRVHDAACRSKGETPDRCSAADWRPALLVVVSCFIVLLTTNVSSSSSID